MSDAPVFRMNPAIDVRGYADTFRRDGIVQIRDIFEPALAELLEKALKDDTYWRLTYPDKNHKSVALNSGQLAKTDLQALAGEIMARASDGFSYVYLACSLNVTYSKPDQAHHPLHKLYNLLNSPEFLAFGRALTGHTDVVRTDATATWYRPGDFLTAHTDKIGLRRAAYTLGLTRRWRVDWGGQLLFHTPRGDVERGYIPAFNVLTMFNIPRPHSVAQVAHYAKERRLTVSGWLFAPQASAQPQPPASDIPGGH